MKTDAPISRSLRRRTSTVVMLAQIAALTLLGQPAPSKPDPTAELFRSLRIGEARVWRGLLATKPDVNVRDEQGNTPLHVAALRSDADAVDALLESGADAKAVNTAGATPLH